MAALAQPAMEGINRLSDCVTFNLSITELGVYPETRGVAYQLWCKNPDGDDFPITEPNRVLPANVNIQPINFDNQVKAFIRTKIIGRSNNPVIQDDGFKKEVYLKYGEALYVAGDCKANQFNLDQETDCITVISSYFQFYQNDPLPETIILTDKPRRYTLCKGSRDWIWVCGNAEVTVDIQDITGKVTLGTPFQISGTTALGVGHLNHAVNPDPNTARIIVKIGKETFTICFKDCCCLCDYSLYFVEPKGTLSNAFFLECVDNVTITRKGNVICSEPGCQTKLGDAISYYGDQYIGCGSWKRLTFKGLRHPKEVTKQFLDAFAMSSKHYVDVPMEDGSIRQVGFILEETEIETFDSDETEIFVTGYISTELLTN